MNWKPIPKEEIARDPKKKTHIRAKFIGTSDTSHSDGAVHPKISYRLFQKVSGRLLNFVKKERRIKVAELSELITDLQQTVSKLQQKKLYLLQKQKKKKKN